MTGERISGNIVCLRPDPPGGRCPGSGERRSGKDPVDKSTACGYLSAELPSESEMLMICHADVSSIFETVLHDLGRDVMEKYIHTIVKSFTVGAYEVLGL